MLESTQHFKLGDRGFSMAGIDDSPVFVTDIDEEGVPGDLFSPNRHTKRKGMILLGYQPFLELDAQAAMCHRVARQDHYTTGEFIEAMNDENLPEFFLQDLN